MLSIINKSDLIIDRRPPLVSFEGASTLGELQWMRSRCRLAASAWFHGRKIVTKAFLKSTVFAAAGLGLMAFASTASAAGVGACLITKTDTNPFFVKMKEGATAEAKTKGARLLSGAGKTDGDNAGQVAASRPVRRAPPRRRAVRAVLIGL